MKAVAAADECPEGNELVSGCLIAKGRSPSQVGLVLINSDLTTMFMINDSASKAIEARVAYLAPPRRSPRIDAKMNQIIEWSATVEAP